MTVARDLKAGAAGPRVAKRNGAARRGRECLVFEELRSEQHLATRDQVPSSAQNKQFSEIPLIGVVFLVHMFNATYWT